MKIDVAALGHHRPSSVVNQTQTSADLGLVTLKFCSKAILHPQTVFIFIVMDNRKILVNKLQVIPKFLGLKHKNF